MTRRERRERQAGVEISGFVIAKASHYLAVMDETFFEALSDFPDPSVWRTHEAGATVRALAQDLSQGRFPNYRKLKQSYPDVQELVVRQVDPWKADLLDRSKLVCFGYQTKGGVRLNDGIDVLPLFWKTKHLSADAVQIVESYKEDGMVQIPLHLVKGDQRLAAAKLRAERFLATLDFGRPSRPARSEMYSGLAQIDLDKLGEASAKWMAGEAETFGDSIRILAEQPPAKLVAGLGWDLGETREGLLLVQDITRLRRFGYSYQAAQQIAGSVAERIKMETGLSAEAKEASGSIQLKVFAVVDLGEPTTDKLKAAIDVMARELGVSTQAELA